MSLLKLYSVTLTYFLKVMKFKNSLKRWELAQNIHRMTFVDLCIWQRMMPLQNLYQMMSIFFLKVKYEVLISRKQWELAQTSDFKVTGILATF